MKNSKNFPTFLRSYVPSLMSIFLALATFMPISAYCEDVSNLLGNPKTSLISLSDLSLSDLSSEQQASYSKLQEGKSYSSIWIISIANIDEVQENGSLRITLPDNENLCSNAIFDGITVKYKSSSSYYWYGTITVDTTAEEGCGEGRLTLIAEKEIIYGSLIMEDKSYSIQDLGGGVRVLCEVNNNHVKSKSCPMGGFEKSESRQEIEPKNQQRSSATCDVKVLMLHTQGAINQVVDINQTMSLAIAQTNQAFQNSAIGNNIQLVSVHSVLIDFIETQSSFNDVNTLALGGLLSSTGQTVNQLRNNYGADIVVLFANGTGWANSSIGRAAAIGPNNNQAFAVVDALAATGVGLVFAHEVGHLFGCRHQTCNATPNVSSCDPTGSIEHAHIFKTGNIFNKVERATIMSSIDLNKTIAHFSNPNVTFSGNNTGTANRNNAQQLTNTSCVVAGFRADVTPLQISISGPKTACPCELVNLCISIPPGITSPTFEWQVSSNSSFNNAPVFSTSICTQISVPCTLSQSKFVKATLTNSNGQSVSVYTTLRASTCPPSIPNQSAIL